MERAGTGSIEGAAEGKVGAQERRDRLAALVLAAAVLLFFGVRIARAYRPLTYLTGDCPYYAATAVSLLQDHDLDLRNQLRGGLEIHGRQIALGRDGAWYPKHPILMPLCALPFLGALGVPGLLIFNLAILVALATVMMRLARPAAPPWAAAAAAFVLLAGTFLRRYDYNFSPDLFATLILCLGLLGCLRGRDASAGFCLGLAVAAKLTHLFLLPAALLYQAWCRGRGGLLRGVAGAAPPLLALGALNLVLFGSPLVTSYDRNVAMADGAPVMVSHRGLFDQNPMEGLSGELFDAKHGLLTTSPLLLLAIPGWVILYRRRPREAVLLIVVVEFLILFFARYRYWSASHYGNRFLMPAVAVAAGPMALSLEWMFQRARALLAFRGRNAIGAAARP